MPGHANELHFTVSTVQVLGWMRSKREVMMVSMDLALTVNLQPFNPFTSDNNNAYAI